MDRSLPLPDRSRLSALTALVLLAYGLIRIVELPAVQTEFAILGLLIRLEFNTQFIMLTTAAALAAAGADWLFLSHPIAQSGRSRIEHLVVPGFAALGAGAILTRVPAGLPLGIGLAFSAILLLAIFTGEFVTYDPGDPRYDLAAAGLRALATLLFVGSIFAIHATRLRAVFAIPLIFTASTAVAWRSIRLGVPQQAVWAYALANGWVSAQVAWSLHYWPVSPVTAALILGMVSYTGVGLSLSHLQERIGLSRIVEFSLVNLIALVAIFLLS